jgi:lysophospholipase
MPDDPRRSLPAGMTLSQWPAPDGWPLRAFDFPADRPAPRGSLLFLGGRGDFIEKYLEAHRHWHDAGWALSGFDWRGQGGSGRLLADTQVGHALDFTPMVDDLAAYVAAWRARGPGPHVVIAHSMGGHLLFRLLARGVALDAAVAVAPMLGLETPLPPPLVNLVVRGANRFGWGERRAWREGERPRATGDVRQRNLTASVERYSDEGWWKAAKPELALGPPSWSWLAAALDSMAVLNRRGVLEAIRTPLLLLAARHDRLVRTRAIERAAARLPDARLAVFDGAHELLREADPIRDAALALIDSFLDQRAPAA